MNRPNFITQNIELKCIEKYTSIDKYDHKEEYIKEYTKKLFDYNDWIELDCYDITGEKFKAICFSSEFTDCEVLYNQLEDIRKNLPEKYIDIIPLDYQLYCNNFIFEDEFSFEEFKNDILDYYPTELIDFILISNGVICIFWNKFPNKIIHPFYWNNYQIYAINRNANISELFTTK